MLAVLAPNGRMHERYSEMFLVLQLRRPLSEVPLRGILMPLRRYGTGEYEKFFCRTAERLRLLNG